MEVRSRPVVPPKPSDLSALRPSFLRPPPFRRSSSAASSRRPAIAPRPLSGSSDGELEQLRLHYPHGERTAPVLSSTSEAGKGDNPEIVPEKDRVSRSKRAQLVKLDKGKRKQETERNVSSTVKSTNSPVAKHNGANYQTHKITNISIQVKLNLNRSFGYKAMDSQVGRSSASPRPPDKYASDTALSAKKSDPAKTNYVKTPKLAITKRSQSSPLEMSINTTPKIISATLKNGQQIRFSSPSRGGDCVDGRAAATSSPSRGGDCVDGRAAATSLPSCGGDCVDGRAAATSSPSRGGDCVDGRAAATSSNMTLDSPRSRGRKSSARRLLIKTPLHPAHVKYPRPQCPFSPVDRMDPMCKQQPAALPSGASPQRCEQRDSIQSEDEQQIQELNSFVSMSSSSTPYAGTTASRDSDVDAGADEFKEDFLRTTPKQNTEVPEGIKRLSSIRGPMNKMRDSLKKALSNPCTSAGLEPSASWQQLPEPSLEKTTLSLCAGVDATPAPTLGTRGGRMVRNVASQTLPTTLEDTTMLEDEDTTAQEEPGMGHKLWSVLMDAIRRAWQRLREALIRLLYPHHNK